MEFMQNRSLHLPTVLVLALLLAGCTTTRPAADPGAAAATRADSADGFKPYDEVITEAAETDEGLFTVHRLDEKLFYEIPDSLHFRTDGGRLAAFEDPVTSNSEAAVHITAASDVLATPALLVEHTQGDETVTVPDAVPLVRSLGLTRDLEREWDADDLSAEARAWDDGGNAMAAVREVAPFDLRERAPTRVGNRMGRPEKSEKRELSPAVHTLFPIGEAGGDQRDVAKAAKHVDGQRGRAGQIEVPVARRECGDCGERTFKSRCPDCDGRTAPVYECDDCGVVVEPDEAGRAECPRCERLADPVEYRTVDLAGEYERALSSVGERPNAFPILKGVKGLTSAEKVPEPIEKGILRSKHGVSAFKDGTVRYDMTDLPVTAVRPSELDVTADQLRELGYETDVDGDPLRFDDQLVELRVQDVVLSDGAAEHMLKTADFVDALLEQYYGMEPFYRVEDRGDLVGELVFGMAPHTSAAVVGRVVGFTSAAVGYAHPYFHAAKRRNCFHPETEIQYEAPDGTIVSEGIAEFVEARLDDPEADDFGTLVEELDGTVRVPSLTDDGRHVLQPVEAVSKHPAPNHLVRIETASGRTLQTTPDHTMLRARGEQIQRVEAASLEVGDQLPLSSPNRVESTSAPVRADGGLQTEAVTGVDIVESDAEHTYCLTVADTHVMSANNYLTGQCDGDEDCVMLLMDGLLNFSRTYLPDQRGGRRGTGRAERDLGEAIEVVADRGQHRDAVIDAVAERRLGC